jgi:hypothetical protein
MSDPAAPSAGAAALAMVCLAADILGRVHLVLTGIYPFNSLVPAIAIIIGTAIVITFVTYVGLKWRYFK